jgi:hypothetical protein
MTIGQLAPILEAAHTYVLSIEDQPDKLSHALAVIIGPEDACPPATRDLIAALRTVDVLSAAIEGQLILPGSSTIAGADGLAVWLLRHSTEIGTEAALADLDTFVAAKLVSMRRVTVLEGLTLVRICQVTDDTELLPWGALYQSPQKEHMQIAFMEQMRFPTAALVRRFELPKVYIDPSIPPKEHYFANVYDDLTDVLNCAGLFGPAGPVVTASWGEAPQWVPTLGTAYSLGYPSPRLNPIQWPADAYERFPLLYKRFIEESSGHRLALRVPLQRLNAAMTKANLVDAAIDCRIAVESLFLSDQQDDRGELTLRICIRAAKFLGSNYAERGEIYDLFRDLYHVGSVAVHSGTLSPTKGGQTVESLLTKGKIKIAESIRKLIDEGPQEWKRVELA